MTYSQYTTDSPSAIKRFSHSARIARAIQLLAPRAEDRILDYGSGDGMLLRRIHEGQPLARLCGFEPRTPRAARQRTADISQFVEIHDSIEDLADFRPTKIACLEVLEHLRPDDLDLALSSIRRLLAHDGLVVVSVPIEIGPASVAKNVVRLAVNQPHRGIHTRNVLRSLFGATAGIERDYEEPYIASHIGFDYRQLSGALRAHGFRTTRHFSPFPGLGPLVNSQVLFTLRATEVPESDA